MKQPFFVVWQPSTGYTKYRHTSQEAAEEEAVRLAKQNLGQEFIVLLSMSSLVVNKVQREEFDLGSLPTPIPF
jgi:hypothetical protein